MNEYIAIDDIVPVLNYQRLIPTVVMWSRLEGRPRTHNFDRALKAEVRDPLFMLTKQLLMGEFEGDDAGSPVFAKVHLETSRFDKFRPDSHDSQAFEYDIPLETRVEARPFPFKTQTQNLALDIRLLMGRQWLKMLHTRTEVSGLINDFKTAFKIDKPDHNSLSDQQICAHREAWAHYAAVASRCMDGYQLYEYLKESADHYAYDRLEVEPTLEQKGVLDGLADDYCLWFERLYYQPQGDKLGSWLASKLEYQFACSAPRKGGEQVFTAEEYYQGHLDWYNFNIDQTTDSLGEVEEDSDTPDKENTFIYTFFPMQIQFDGMPNTRWWSFEEGKTNFSGIKPDTTDINKLLLMEFGLVYANDWFLLPFTVPAGSVARVRGIAVTNVFGERIWVKPAGADAEEDWRHWSMFALNSDRGTDGRTDSTLLILPTVPKIQEGAPIEEVQLFRDEMANMVWGMESTIQLPNGKAKSGREAALELRQFIERHYKATLPPSSDEDNTSAAIAYQLMNSVPENWIPFVPVHVEGERREIQLQRAAMPRIIEGPVAITRIRPRTSLLRPGLDETVKQAYKIFEEEVPRAGVKVMQSYQRTRWYNGKVYNWLGVRKQTGHGEQSSGLVFDILKSTA